MPVLKVWDLSTRIVHWSIVCLVILSWWSAETGLHLVHRLAGYAMLTVVAYRIYWGFAGSDTARFRSFLRGRSAVLGYVDTLFDRDQVPYAGHNPLGGWSTVLLLAVLLLQCAAGLAAITVEGTHGGPLSRYLSFDLAREMASIHHRMFNVLMLLIAVHVASIAFYWFVKRQNLLLPMITGLKSLPQGSDSPADFRSGRAASILALLGFCVAALLLELGR